MSPSYSHRQTGVAPLFVGAIGLAVAVILSLPFLTGWKFGPLFFLTMIIIAIVVGVVFVVFTHLTVEIGPNELRWKFGFGFPKYSMALSDIVSSRIVTNDIGYGYGIRMIPNGMLYNIAGSQAVELVTADKKVVRIGTDEPQVLLEAIQCSIPTVRF